MSNLCFGAVFLCNQFPPMYRVTLILFSITGEQLRNYCQDTWSMRHRFGSFHLILVSPPGPSCLFAVNIRNNYIRHLLACRDMPQSISTSRRHSTQVSVSGVLFRLSSLIVLYSAHRAQYGYSGCSMPDLTAVSLRIMSTLVNDTLVFVAITYRLAADAMPTKGRRRFRLFSVVKGEGLYSLSRSLLQGGQLYYL